MEVNYTDKWNHYEIGNVVWINKRRDHGCRRLFINYVTESNYQKILEIGAGECIEAMSLKKIVDYTVCDVSDTFLSYAQKNGIKTIKGDMINIPTKDKFDLVYLCMVLEHTPDIRKTILELKRVSKYYFITMFKWQYRGKLDSTYRPERKFYSTDFNINMIFALLEKHSSIIRKAISFNDNNCIMEYNEYIKSRNLSGIHRNGNYLSIIGKWND